MQFLELFKSLCKQKGVTQKKALADMGFGPSSNQTWKTGKPSFESLITIAEYFGVTTDWLLAQCAEDGAANGGNIIGSAVIQGSLGSSIKYNSADPDEERPEVNEQEAELLRIFRGLDMKGKIAVLSFAYAEEERQNTK